VITTTTTFFFALGHLHYTITVRENIAQWLADPSWCCHFVLVLSLLHPVSAWASVMQQTCSKAFSLAQVRVEIWTAAAAE
jgi:hypothetical protein